MSIFRVRNLLIQVLPRECDFGSCGFESCDFDSEGGGDCGDVSVVVCDDSDCGDTGGDCGDPDTGGGCDIDSCGDPDTGGGCDIDSCGDPDTGGGGCGADSCGTDSCGNPDTGGCGNPDTGCAAGTTSQCDAGTSGCTAFECSLHFDTICQVGRDPSACEATTPLCFPGGITIDCHIGERTLDCFGMQPTQCNILNSLPLCPDVTNTQLRQPIGLCFRSDEPKLNPNSLADLGLLRRQLVAALRVVQRRERGLAKALTPRTTRQIATAEAYLSSALRDLKRRKQFVQARVAEAKKAIGSKKKAAPAKAAKKSPAKKSPARKGRRRK